VVDEIRPTSFVLLNKYYSGVQIEKNEIDRACGMHRRQERCIQGFDGKT